MAPLVQSALAVCSHSESAEMHPCARVCTWADCDWSGVFNPKAESLDPFIYPHHLHMSKAIPNRKVIESRKVRLWHYIECGIGSNTEKELPKSSLFFFQEPQIFQHKILSNTCQEQTFFDWYLMTRRPSYKYNPFWLIKPGTSCIWCNGDRKWGEEMCRERRKEEIEEGREGGWEAGKGPY